MTDHGSNMISDMEAIPDSFVETSHNSIGRQGFSQAFCEALATLTMDFSSKSAGCSPEYDPDFYHRAPRHFPISFEILVKKRFPEFFEFAFFLEYFKVVAVMFWRECWFSNGCSFEIAAPANMISHPNFYTQIIFYSQSDQRLRSTE